MRLAFAFAFDSAGKSIAARMAMMAMTTRSSIKVNAQRVPPRRRWAHFLISDFELNEFFIMFQSVTSQSHGGHQ